MAAIVVKPLGQREFQVNVHDRGRETRHHVTVPSGFRARYGLESAALQTIVERSFEFLLEREPANAILGRFTLDEISRYFPEYAGEIAQRTS